MPARRGMSGSMPHPANWSKPAPAVLVNKTSFLRFLRIMANTCSSDGNDQGRPEAVRTVASDIKTPACPDRCCSPVRPSHVLSLSPGRASRIPRSRRRPAAGETCWKLKTRPMPPRNRIPVGIRFLRIAPHWKREARRCQALEGTFFSDAVRYATFCYLAASAILSAAHWASAELPVLAGRSFDRASLKARIKT